MQWPLLATGGVSAGGGIGCDSTTVVSGRAGRERVNKISWIATRTHRTDLARERATIWESVRVSIAERCSIQAHAQLVSTAWLPVTPLITWVVGIG